MKPRDIVAIILAVTVMFVLTSSTGTFRSFFGLTSQDLNANAVEAWQNIMFTIIGALSGYIAGKESE